MAVVLLDSMTVKFSERLQSEGSNLHTAVMLSLLDIIRAKVIFDGPKVWECAQE